tara:strand:- start:243 stop:614 length:372 start_codon:yes stop_codon:yes gene_type:complete
MKRYDHQPGNATRYDLLYGKIEGSNTYALVLLNGAHEERGGSMTFIGGETPSASDVQRAMRLTYGGDATALAHFIADRNRERSEERRAIDHLQKVTALNHSELVALGDRLDAIEAILSAPAKS